MGLLIPCLFFDFLPHFWPEPGHPSVQPGLCPGLCPLYPAGGLADGLQAALGAPARGATASTLNDPLMMRDAPRTLEGIYRYTLGAFPQMKFAFPLWAIPDRIVLYLYPLQQNFDYYLGEAERAGYDVCSVWACRPHRRCFSRGGN